MTIKPYCSVYAPGRVNLIGEHTDYNGGKVLPCAISQGLECNMSLRLPPGEGYLVLKSDHFPDKNLSLPMARVLEMATTRVIPQDMKNYGMAYVIGAIALVKEHFVKQALELEINLTSDIPLGSGLSSSAALSCALVAGLKTLFQIKVDLNQCAREAQAIEHSFAGVPCGLMDQLAVCFGLKNQFLVIDFRNFGSKGCYELETIQAHKPFQDYELLLIQSQVKHNLAHSPYAQRKQTCIDALQQINLKAGTSFTSLSELSVAESFSAVFDRSLSSLSQDDFESMLEDLGWLKSIDQDNFQASGLVAHVIFENLRVDSCRWALLEGDVRSLHSCLERAHRSLRDSYKVSCAEIESLRQMIEAWVMSQSENTDIMLGPRMTGGGFGGSLVAWVKKDRVSSLEAFLTAPGNPYHKSCGRNASVLRTEAGEGMRICDS